MARVHFVNFLHDGPRETSFGTCDYCFSTGTIDQSNPRFVFRDDEGKFFEVDGYDWDWGDYYSIEVDNVVDFGAWLSDQELTLDDVMKLRDNDFYTLRNLSYKYEKCLRDN